MATLRIFTEDLHTPLYIPGVGPDERSMLIADLNSAEEFIRVDGSNGTHWVRRESIVYVSYTENES